MLHDRGYVGTEEPFQKLVNQGMILGEMEFTGYQDSDGKAVSAAEQAADLLAERGISVRLVDARFVKPLDADALVAAAERCSRIVTVEDHMAVGGFGSAVLELLAIRAPEARVLVCGLCDRFVEHGDTDAQWVEAGIDADSIADRTTSWLKKT